MSKGIYVITIEDVPDMDRPRSLVRRVEETDADINELSLRLEALVEDGVIGGYTIVGQNLPQLATDSSIYTDILRIFWHADVSTEAKDGVDAILYDDDILRISQAWEQGWRNRDAYFTNNARRSIK